MSNRHTHRLARGALTLLVGGLVGGLAGGLVVGTAGGASAHPAEPEGGVAAMSSPYIPDVPHVPADVVLALGPDGSADGARFIGPEGSVFNGLSTRSGSVWTRGGPSRWPPARRRRRPTGSWRA